MYHYANRPGLSTKQSRQVLSESYNTSVNGLPGNDDSGMSEMTSHTFQFNAEFSSPGAMASYAVFLLAGLYPVPATKQYLLSSPSFPSVSFSNKLLNTTTTIKAINWAGNPPDGVGQVYVAVNIQYLWARRSYVD